MHIDSHAIVAVLKRENARMKNTVKCAIAAATVSCAALFSPAVQAVPVALELALLIDVSGSVDANEFTLQRNGYVNAFNDPVIQQQIIDRGGIAVTYIVWSGAAQQAQQVGWTLVNSAATATAFATAVAATTQVFGGLTAPGSAINFARPLFGTETGGTDNGYESLRQVIDVSGDGEQNDGANTATARNNALAAGVDAINGLAIGGIGLFNWYQANIQGGAGAFTIQAADFAAFDGAVRSKIGREITQVPEPGTLALLGLGGLAFGFARRRKV